MTPDVLTAIAALGKLAELLTTWPVAGGIVTVILGPWLVVVFVSAAQERRFKAVVQMYKDNVELVKKAERTSESMENLVVYVTEILTKVLSLVENNWYCPLMRTKPPGSGTMSHKEDKPS